MGSGPLCALLSAQVMEPCDTDSVERVGWSRVAWHGMAWHGMAWHGTGRGSDISRKDCSDTVSIRSDRSHHILIVALTS